MYLQEDLDSNLGPREKQRKNLHQQCNFCHFIPVAWEKFKKQCALRNEFSLQDLQQVRVFAPKPGDLSLILRAQAVGEN